MSLHCPTIGIINDKNAYEVKQQNQSNRPRSKCITCSIASWEIPVSTQLVHNRLLAFHWANSVYKQNKSSKSNLGRAHHSRTTTQQSPHWF